MTYKFTAHFNPDTRVWSVYRDSVFQFYLKGCEFPYVNKLMGILNKSNEGLKCET